MYSVAALASDATQSAQLVTSKVAALGWWSAGVWVYAIGRLIWLGPLAVILWVVHRLWTDRIARKVRLHGIPLSWMAV